jgi:hypothetical protein
MKIQRECDIMQRFMTQQFVFLASFLLAVCLLVPITAAQDDDPFPVTINAYVFSIAETQIRSLMEDGLSRAELDLLQGKFFDAGCLLPKFKPLTVQSGENVIKISKEQILGMQETEETEVIVLFFEVVKKEGYEVGAGVINRLSYAVTVDKDGGQKRIGEKKSKWNYPANSPIYRYMDFRSAILFRYEQLVYDLNVVIGDEKKDISLIFKLSE